jgi:hypothetical protein
MVFPCGSAEPGGQLIDDLLLVGELSRLELGVDPLAVGAQLEAASPRGDELQLLDSLFERRE